METEPTHDPVKDAVLERIRSGGLTMRPKLYFAFRAALVVALACAVLALSILLAGFIAFGIRVGGHDSLLSFGPRGLQTFVLLFPWPLAALDLALAGLLAWLLRQFRFGYRRSLALLVLAGALVALSAGLLLDRGTPFEDALYSRAEHGEIPGPFGSAYEAERRAAPEELGVFRGVIVRVDGDRFEMTYDDLDRDDDETSWTVILPPGTATTTLHAGDRAYVAGDADGSLIEAYGVRVLPERK